MSTQQADESGCPASIALWIFWDSWRKAPDGSIRFFDVIFVNPNRPIPLHAGNTDNPARGRQGASVLHRRELEVLHCVGSERTQECVGSPFDAGQLKWCDL